MASIFQHPCLISALATRTSPFILCLSQMTLDWAPASGQGRTVHIKQLPRMSHPSQGNSWLIRPKKAGGQGYPGKKPNHGMSLAWPGDQLISVHTTFPVFAPKEPCPRFPRQIGITGHSRLVPPQYLPRTRSSWSWSMKPSSTQADQRECSKCTEKGKDEPRLQVVLRTATSEIRSHNQRSKHGTNSDRWAAAEFHHQHDWGFLPQAWFWAHRVGFLKIMAARGH